MKSLLVALLLLPALPALAAGCEDSFAKKGNTFTGTTFSGSVTVPNLSVESALGQMRAIVTAKGMDVLTEDAESGTMMIEDPETATHKPLPMIPPYIGSRLISLRAYDAGHMMVHADVMGGTEVAHALESVFEDKSVSYVHLHNAKRGCFACLATRASGA